MICCTAWAFPHLGLQSVSEESNDNQVVPASPSGRPITYQDSSQDTVNVVTEIIKVC